MKINNLKSLRMETDRLRYKIRVDREKFATELKLLRFHMIEFVITEIVRLFKGNGGEKESAT